MAAETLVQVQIDTDVKERASAVLSQHGYTVDQAVRLLLERTAEDGELPFLTHDDPEYTVWLEAKVQEALDDPRPLIPHEEVKARIAKRRAEILNGITRG